MGKRRGNKKPKRREHRPIHDVVAPVGKGAPRDRHATPGTARARASERAPEVLEVPQSSAAVGAFRAFSQVNRVSSGAPSGTSPSAPTQNRTPSGKRRSKRRPRGLLKRLINRRRIVQAAIGVGVYVLVARYNINLWWVVLFGSALGIVLGKVFCRWMCPMGFIMELIMASGDKAKAQSSMYMYFKVGCPIAWISGMLNKISLFRVKLDPDKCSHCGVCEDACYISEFNAGHGLHRPGAINASTHYSCSRCLACVSACPTGALSLGTALPAKASREIESRTA